MVPPVAAPVRSRGVDGEGRTPTMPDGAQVRRPSGAEGVVLPESLMPERHHHAAPASGSIGNLTWAGDGE